MIRQAARDFAQNELKPGVIERDEHQKFPAEQIKKLGELGFMGMMVAEQYGGSGMDCDILCTGDGGTFQGRCLSICSGFSKQFVGLLRA